MSNTMPQTAAARQGRAQYHHMAQTLRDLESDLRWGMENSARIPPEWHEIAQAQPEPHKVPVTLRLDEDVLRFFKATGRGHLTRMNAVLRAFMQARLARVVKGPEDVVHQPTPMEQYMLGLAELVHQIAARNDRAMRGLDCRGEDHETAKRVAVLRKMEDKLELAPHMRMRI